MFNYVSNYSYELRTKKKKKKIVFVREDNITSEIKKDKEKTKDKINMKSVRKLALNSIVEVSIGQEVNTVGTMDITSVEMACA